MAMVYGSRIYIVPAWTVDTHFEVIRCGERETVKFKWRIGQFILGIDNSGISHEFLEHLQDHILVQLAVLVHLAAVLAVLPLSDVQGFVDLRSVDHVLDERVAGRKRM